MMSKIIMNLENSKQELNIWIIDVLKLNKDFSLKIKMTQYQKKINERNPIAGLILMKMLCSVDIKFLVE